MTEETDAAVRMARHHLEEAGVLVQDVWEKLDAARNATAHLGSGGMRRDRDPRGEVLIHRTRPAAPHYPTRLPRHGQAIHCCEHCPDSPNVSPDLDDRPA
ncbi:MAG: hypothetical protein ABIQ15_01345 [Nocardioides sp.]